VLRGDIFMVDWFSAYQNKVNINGSTIREQRINIKDQLFSSTFKDAPEYQQIGLGSTSTFYDSWVFSGQAYKLLDNQKKLSLEPTQSDIPLNFFTGQYVYMTINSIDEIWLTIASDINNADKPTCTIEKCNSFLKFIDSDGTIQQFPCVIESSKRFTKNNVDAYFILPVGMSRIYIQYNSITDSIIEGQRFVLGKRVYKVDEVDDYSQIINNKGLISLVLELTQKIDDDNIELGIANYYSRQHTYLVDILNGSSAQNVNDVITLNIVCTDNTVQVTSPILSYVSSNPLIATVNNGIITCISEGVSTITVAYNGVSASINITVQSAVIADNYTVSITGNSTVKLGANLTLTSTVFNNGVADASKSVVWNISNQDLSSNIYVSVVSQTVSSITLKTTSNSNYINKYITIRASKSDDVSIYDEFTIQTKSLM